MRRKISFLSRNILVASGVTSSKHTISYSILNARWRLFVVSTTIWSKTTIPGSGFCPLNLCRSSNVRQLNQVDNDLSSAFTSIVGVEVADFSSIFDSASLSHHQGYQLRCGGRQAPWPESRSRINRCCHFLRLPTIRWKAGLPPRKTPAVRGMIALTAYAVNHESLSNEYRRGYGCKHDGHGLEESNWAMLDRRQIGGGVSRHRDIQGVVFILSLPSYTTLSCRRINRQREPLAVSPRA